MTCRVVMAAMLALRHGGIGTMAYAAVSATRWPARDDEAWRYLVIDMHPGGPPQA